MANFDDDFLRFLETYYKGDYDLVKADKTDAAVLNSIYNNHIATFEVWSKLPSALQYRYGTEIPYDVRETALRGEYLTLREMEYHPEIKTAAEARQAVEEHYKSVPDDIVNDMAAGAFVAAVIAGYSLQAAHDLAEQRQFRESLRDKALNGTLTDEEKKEWIKSREIDINTIKKEWKERHPEKMLLHLLSKYNRGHLSREELLPMVDEFALKIKRDGRQDKLLELLKRPHIQAKLYHFKPETVDILARNVLPHLPQSEENSLLLSGKFRNTPTLNLSAEQQSRIISYSLNNQQNRLPPKRTLDAQQLRNSMLSITRE